MFGASVWCVGTASEPGAEVALAQLEVAFATDELIITILVADLLKARLQELVNDANKNGQKLRGWKIVTQFGKNEKNKLSGARVVFTIHYAIYWLGV